MSAAPMSPHATAPSAADLGEAERRRRVRRSAMLFGVIAAAFYVGFIVMMLARGMR